MTEFKDGDIVIINGNLEKTRNKWGLDEHGEMKSMKGKSFEICGSSSIAVYIVGPKSNYKFTFAKEDVTRAVMKKIDPIVVDFDIKHLDI